MNPSAAAAISSGLSPNRCKRYGCQQFRQHLGSHRRENFRAYATRGNRARADFHNGRAPWAQTTVSAATPGLRGAVACSGRHCRASRCWRCRRRHRQSRARTMRSAASRPHRNTPVRFTSITACRLRERHFAHDRAILRFHEQRIAQNSSIVDEDIEPAEVADDALHLFDPLRPRTATFIS